MLRLFAPLPPAAAALAGMAGLALGRASHHQGVQRLLVTALAVAAVPLASSALGSLLGLGRRQGQPRGFAATGPARTFADREARRRQLRRAAAGAFDQAAAEGAISADERGLMAAILVRGSLWLAAGQRDSTRGPGM